MQLIEIHVYLENSNTIKVLFFLISIWCQSFSIYSVTCADLVLGSGGPDPPTHPPFFFRNLQNIFQIAWKTELLHLYDK